MRIITAKSLVGLVTGRARAILVLEFRHLPDGSWRDGGTRRVRSAGDIEALYRLFLGRAAESERICQASYGKAVLEIIEEMIASEEFREEVIDRLLASGSLPHDLLSAAELIKVAEFTAAYGLAEFASMDFASANDYAIELVHLDGAAFIQAAYRALLVRDPDPEGEQYYLAQLGDPEITKPQIVAEIMESEEFRQRGRSWRMICGPQSANLDYGPGDRSALPFGWRSMLYRVLASDPVLRVLEQHHGPSAREFVAALQPAHPDLILHVGAPGSLGGPETIPIRDRLLIDGWALARHGVASIEIAAGERNLGAAHYGLPHAGAGAAFPDWPQTGRSGFAVMISAQALPPEVRVVRVVLRDHAGETATVELFIERIAEDAQEPVRSASLAAEIDFYHRLLTNCDWWPHFCLVAAIAIGGEPVIEEVRTNLAALRAQPYREWRLVAVVTNKDPNPLDALSNRLLSGVDTVRSLQQSASRDRSDASDRHQDSPLESSESLENVREHLLDGFPDIADRVAAVSAQGSRPLAEIVRQQTRGRPALVVMLAPGAEPAMDMLFELAAVSAIHPEAELITSERTDGRSILFCVTLPLIKCIGIASNNMIDVVKILQLTDPAKVVNRITLLSRPNPGLPESMASFSLKPLIRQSTSIQQKTKSSLPICVVKPASKNAEYTNFNIADNRTRTLSVSILCLGRPNNVIRLLASLPHWLSQFSSDRNFQVAIVIRNNDPKTPSDIFQHSIDETKEIYPQIDFHLINGESNLGFGKGHNENYKKFPADYFMILNDDLAFPNFDWLYTAIDLMEKDPTLAFLGAESNPRTISPFFANGHFPNPGRVETLQYVEASVMLAKGKIFEGIGMFNDQIEWAMCEDSDLSLRAQSLGYRIGWIPIPHEHWRSSSFNSLPNEVKFSILEHNRATLISFWRNTISSGVIGRYDVFDIWSDGLGDVFCVLPHLWQYLRSLPAERRATTIINTSAPNLVKLVVDDDVIIENLSDISLLYIRYEADGISSIRSIRGLNYSIPTHMQTLLCGVLSIPVVSESVRKDFEIFLINRLSEQSTLPTSLEGNLCVIHLETTRRNFAGRGPKSNICEMILEVITQHFDQIAVVGLEQQWPITAQLSRRENIFDFRGKLSLMETMRLISGANLFVGVDSLPAHVAQACGVKSAILFGSVHPLVWVWDQQRVWPIVASLPCIGCYQTHLEPSVPFCMRRDEACMAEISEETIRSQIESAVRGKIFDWSGLSWQFRGLQAKFFRYLHYHPAPPERAFRPQISSNEQISNLIFEITDRMADMLRNQYQTGAVMALRSRVSDLERELCRLQANV